VPATNGVALDLADAGQAAMLMLKFERLPGVPL